MIAGLAIGAFALGIFIFGLCEIRIIKKRDDKLKTEIRKATMASLDRVLKVQNEQSFYPAS